MKQSNFELNSLKVITALKKILFILPLFIIVDALAQTGFLKLKPEEQIHELGFDTLVNASTTDKIFKHLSEVQEKLINNNYLEASVDSIVFDTISQKQNAFFHIGPQYSFDSLKLDSSAITFLNELKLTPPKDVEAFLLIRENIKSYYGQRGYPFCKIYLDDLKLKDNQLNGQLNINTGPQIYIDSVKVNGDLKIRQAFIENYLDFDDDAVYNHERVLKIKSDIDRLTFLNQVKNPELQFYFDRATVNLFLEPKNASRFDLIFGIIPTNNIPDRQLFLSLDFTAEMRNKLGLGEYIFLNFERLRPEQQKFEVEFNYPYLLGLPFAFDTRLSIFRNALNFSTLQSDIGIQYLINQRDYLKLSWNFESTDVIDVDTSFVQNFKMLPEDLDVSQTGLAITLHLNRLDYLFNPRSGFMVNLKAIAGQKTIKKNPTILQLIDNDDPPFNFATLYDDLQLNAPRFEFQSDISYYLPLALRGAIGLHLKSGWRYTALDNKDQVNLSRNEKFQIGGNKILRGFDEASFFTSFYGISTLEYRLLLSNNSYISIPFVDFGFLENAQEQSIWAMGIGASLGIETKVGLFNFSIASGRTQDVDFDLARPKAHFGFISLF